MLEMLEMADMGVTARSSVTVYVTPPWTYLVVAVAAPCSGCAGAGAATYWDWVAISFLQDRHRAPLASDTYPRQPW